MLFASSWHLLDRQRRNVKTAFCHFTHEISILTIHGPFLTFEHSTNLTFEFFIDSNRRGVNIIYMYRIHNILATLSIQTFTKKKTLFSEPHLNSTVTCWFLYSYLDIIQLTRAVKLEDSSTFFFYFY